MAHLGQCSSQAPGRLSCLDPGRTQNTCLTESVPLRSIREPKLSSLDLGSAWNAGHALDSVLQSTLEPEQCRPESTLLSGAARCCELGQTQCGPNTASPPNTCQRYLFAVFLPPHNTTKQVSLNNWPPSPPCDRVEIRHWGDLETEEVKIKKRERLWKWQVQ